MAKTSTQIEIPVSLKASLEGLKEVKTQVSQALDKAGKNTTLGKTLAKELSTVAAKFGEIDEILLSPTIDESGLKRLERLADQVSSHFAQSFAKIDFSSFEQFATEDQLTRMRELQELTRKQRRELEAINKHGSQERTDTYLVRTDNEVALNHMRNYKGFDATQTLSKNQQAMERLSQSHERTIASMKKQLEEYDQKANESFNAWDAADKRVKALEPQVATLRKDSYAATFYDKIGRMNTRISANPETVNPRISSIEKELGSALRSIEAGGVIATEARDALKDWITHTFTNINSAEAGQMVGMTVNKLLEKLMEKIFGQGYEADREGGYDLSHAALLARGQDFADNSVKRLNAKHSTNSASDLALVNQQKIKELREAQAEATTQENAAERYMDLGMALETQIAETQQAANHTRFLAQELGRYAEAAKRAAQASKQGEINDSEQAQRDYAAQAKQAQEANYAHSKETYGDIKPGLAEGFKEAGDSMSIANTAAAEAEDFKKHLKQSIAHWASAQQIINVVKDGIRQAYQDIKALDSAMTNIAVVTDMSIGDLWGKINEYMSIAKQYGVTTQGVYEVSQLYYQQGLSTNEVMAATTETLKMARIAGMDYSEAADAMTVAIRAFKMEMTDAEHVTDVYSKVAAVTASDSEELAIAMSKTASSAESVGSSFENTTAMLAVMIETTRESAQNLGSALKSIISRYGEMKIGLTVDSEGEEIDYNKVDTALKSVGISIKDAQGQFRDFDDVIFELSEKWDSLDKNTQRYIATIMAGNRQQSRFIALVDNWERLEEVGAAAADSADAGLLQYAKTMDSLDTKLNTLKTNFQQFYMSIFNGEFFKGVVDIANNIVTSFSRLGPILGGLNLLKLINQIKMVAAMLVNTFANGFQKIIKSNKEWQEKMTGGWPTLGEKIGNFVAKGINTAVTQELEKIKQQVNAFTTPQSAAAQALALSKNGLVSSDTAQMTKISLLTDYQNKAKDLGDSPIDEAGQRFKAMVKQASAQLVNGLEHATDEELDAALSIIAKEEQSTQQQKQTLETGAKNSSSELCKGGQDAGNALRSGAVGSSNSIGAKYNRLTNTKGASVVGQAMMGIGTILSAASYAQDTSTMEGYDRQGVMNFAGGALNAGAQFLTGNWVGAVITGVTTIAEGITHLNNRAQVEFENAEKALEKAEIDRAQKKEESENLESTINNLKKLQAARYDSEEAMQAYLEASDAAIEKYPELANTIDANGRKMADVLMNTTQSEQLLLEARKAAAQATYKAAIAERNKIAAEISLREQNKKAYTDFKDVDYSMDQFFDPSYWFIQQNQGQDDLVSGLGISTEDAFNITRAIYDTNSDLYKNIVIAAEKEGVTVAQKQQELDKYIFGLMGGEKDIVGANSTNAYEALQYHDSLFDSSVNQQYSSSLTAGNQAAIHDKAAEYFVDKRTQTEPAWQDVDWLSNLATSYVESNLDITNDDFDENGLSGAGLSKINESTKLVDAELDQFYLQHAEDLDEIYDLITQASQGKISKDEYIAELKKFGINENSFIYTPLMDQYYQQDNARRAFYANALLGERFRTSNYASYDTWLAAEEREDNAESREEYHKALIAEIATYDENNQSLIDELLAHGSLQELEEYNKLVEEGRQAAKMTGPARGVTQDRIRTMQDMYTSLYDEDSQLAGLSSEAQAEFFRLMNTDAGTHEWAQNLEAFEKQYGINLADWDTLAFENFSVRTQNIIDNATEVTDTIRKIGEKQSKGFSWEESQKLLKQIQAIDPSATWTSLFKVTEDGLIVLEDANDAIKQLYIQQATDLDNQQAAINNVIGASQAKQNALEDSIFSKLTDDQWKNLNDTASASVASDIMSILNISDPELEAEILAGIQTGAIHSYESLITFLEEQREVLEAAGIYVDAQIEQLQGANAFQTWSSGKVVDTSQMKMEGTLADYGDIWTKQINKEHDTTGWTQDIWDAAFAAEQQALLDAGAHIDKLGNVIWESEKDMVKYFVEHLGYTDEVAKELAAGAQYADWLNEETNADKLQGAAESFTKELIETGEVAAETVDAFVQAIAPNADNETKLAIKNDILRAIETDSDPANIVANIATAYGIDIDQEMIDADAIAADAINDRTKLFFELYGKWIEGTITETELIEFKDLGKITGYALPNLTKEVGESARETVEAYGIMLQEALKTGNQAAIDSAREGFKNATVDYLNQLALDREFGAGGEGLDLYSTIGNINKAAGVYTSEMFGAIAGQTDGSFDFEAFNKYYTWDSEAQGFIQTGAGTTKEALIAIYGEDVPEAIINAYDASEFDKEVQKAIEHDNNLTSIPEKFASLISDPLNASLDELIKFWESLLGRELSTDEYQKVYDARQAAINGNTEMLNNMFDDWSSLAINQGYDVRWETIKQATFGEQAKNQANVEKWLNGEGTVDDLGQLWIDQYDAAVTDATLEQFINKKIGSMRGAFIDAAGNLIITDYEEFMSYLAQEGLVDEATLTQYAAEIQDTTLETIKSIFDYINKAIEGTLTATELRDMGQAVVNSGTMSADEWHTFASQNIGRVGTGYKMNEVAAFALQVNTGNYDFEDLVDQFDSIEEVNEMLEELSENSKQFGDEFVNAAKRVLESIKMIKAQDPGDAMFNWMDQDMEGWAGTYESTMGSIGKAGEVINASMESGTMGLNDFYNMSQIVGQHLTGDALREWEQYRDAVYATATTVDGGTVSLTAGGKSMEYALNAMSESTEAYYQKIAKQQIAFIDKQIAALEAQKAVEEALGGYNGGYDMDEDGAPDYSPDNYKEIYDNTVITGKERDNLGNVQQGATGYDIDEEAAKLAYYRNINNITDEKWNALTHQEQQNARAEALKVNEDDYQKWFVTQFIPRMDEIMKVASATGMDLTDPAVVQSLADTALARMGIEGYEDIFSNSEELDTLTNIKTSVANIEKAVVDKPANTAGTDEVPPPVNNPNPSTTEEDILNHFNEVVITSGNQYGWGFAESGQMDEQQSSFIIDEMTKAFGDTWREVVQNSTQTVGGSQYTGSYLYGMNFAPQNVPAEVIIADTSEQAQAEAQNTSETFQSTLNDNPTHIHIGGDTTGAWTAAKRIISKINALTAAVKVNLDIQPATVQVTSDGDVDAVTFASPNTGATGNVNGLAFATGTEKLIAGANLANKSLVGELGPELAVYNGQYHLLGANGAEFANIPSNAIIFNHKQTEGILKGQANIRGRVKDGGEAFAEGNVSGPAYASGIDEAIAALQEARAMWQSLLNTPLDKILGRNKASGGGSGISAVDIGELEEWYNLLRQIEAIQDKINLLVAERNNLEAEYNGEATLRNLRQQQSLLEKQRATQEQLMKYQRIQLERQKNEILNDPVWNKFLTFDESTGAIQYTKGNELFGGKGAWEFLQDLDQMSAKEQIAAVNKLGYTAKDKEGKQLTGEELVKHFVDAAKNIEEEYRNLDNTVRESETELENINSNINGIEKTIRDNEKALEQDVFDTIIDAWEANIDALEEQKDLIEEANDAYAEGLREALDAERKAYEDEASVADREQLQRELSLLRRSGGSASEIADLEGQIDNALKDEYFKSQEDMIADIEEANKNQIELLEKQIKIEEETLEYQKENGIIWQQVATILSGTKESIMAFLSGSAPGFFAKSKNQQIDALNQWSYMIGLYKEDQLIKNTSTQVLNDMNNSNGQMWGHTDMSGYYKKFSSSEMTDKERKSAADAYATEYAKLLSEGKTEEQAAEGARKVLRDRIDQYSTPAPKGGDIKPPVNDGKDNKVKYDKISCSISASPSAGGRPVLSTLKASPHQTVTVLPKANSGYIASYYTVGGKRKEFVNGTGSFKPTGNYASVKVVVYYIKTPQRSGDKQAISKGDNGEHIYANQYSNGGLVDYTGLAMVHGSSSKPEAFLNAEQTAQIKDALMLQTKEGLLSSLQDSLLKFQSTIDGTVSGITSEANNSSINIQPGAVVIQVEELANNYDVEKLSNDVMNRMTAIAAKATNRGVNRR